MTGETGVDANLAAEFAEYAMMSSNSYHDPNRPKFDLRSIGWQLISIDGKIIEEQLRTGSYSGILSGLAYDLYRKETGGIVMALRGTDSLQDWLFTNFAMPFSIQYKSAHKHFRRIGERLGNVEMVTGHSLGGGIALSLSVRYGVDALVFDASPRIFDGLGDRHAKARRRLVFQNEDPLGKVRAHWAKISEVVRPEDTFVANFDFQGESAHSAHLLARGLLEMGASQDARLKSIAGQLPPPVVWTE